MLYDLAPWAEPIGAVVAALLGGMGTRFFENKIRKRSEKLNEAAIIREELRKDIDLLREDLEKYKHEADGWRIKYYEKIEENLRMQTEIEMLKSEMIYLKGTLKTFTTGPSK
jgi:chromosome segregation ATPase